MLQKFTSLDNIVCIIIIKNNDYSIFEIFERLIHTNR